MTAKKRVLILCLDGFTWHLGRRFMQDGVMPNLKRLVENGCHGNLESVIPFETAPGWSAFQTGCRPGKTDVFTFHRYQRSENQIFLNSYASIKVPTVWELASAAGKTVVSINLPVTTPAPKVNGIIIPGLLCPKISEETVYPEEAYETYIKPRQDYHIINRQRTENHTELVDQLIRTVRARTDVARQIMKDVDWDLFCVQFQSTDQIQHKMWPALDPDHVSASAESRQAGLRFYRACDEMVGQIIEAAGEDVLVFVASDHGFCASIASVALNKWLEGRGYLHLKDESEQSAWVRAKSRFKILKSLAGFYGRTKRKILKSDAVGKPYYHTNFLHLRQIIDMEKSQAFCLGGMCGLIYVLEKDAQKRAEQTRKIKEELWQELGPGSTEKAVKKIYTGLEVYGQNHSESMPDLVVEYAQGYESLLTPRWPQVITPKPGEGTHSRQGIFILHGSEIKKGQTFDAELIDVTPTVLAYLGIDVPDHMDGQVLTKAFEGPLEYHRSQSDQQQKEQADYTNEEQAHVEEHLRHLGYM